MREWRELRLYFRALADVRRLRIVSLLTVTPEISAKELSLQLRASQPLISWHLRVLVRCGLVRTRRQDRQVFCSLDRTVFLAYQERLNVLLGGGKEETASAHDEASRVFTPVPQVGTGG